MKWIACVLLLVGVCAIGSRGVAQESKATTAEAVDEAPPPRRLRGRLPNNYGKLGLTDKQKQNVYGIQAKYKAQIEALEAQIEALKVKRDKEIEGSLTPLQKERLDEILDEKAKKLSR